MPYRVTDNTCGHTILTVADRAVADHQAHVADVADVAGYPTTTLRVHALTGRDLCPPPDCARCWHRVADTIVIMQRDRVAARAITAGACPFEAVALFDRLRSKGVTLAEAAAAVTAPQRIAFLATTKPIGRWTRPRRELDPPNVQDQEMDPAWFTEPATIAEPPSRAS